MPTTERADGQRIGESSSPIHAKLAQDVREAIFASANQSPGHDGRTLGQRRHHTMLNEFHLIRAVKAD